MMEFKKNLEREKIAIFKDLKKEYPVLNEAEIKEGLQEELTDYSYNHYLEQIKKFPYYDEVEFFEEANKEKEKVDSSKFIQYIGEIRKLNQSAKLPFNIDYWIEEFQKLDEVKDDKYQEDSDIFKNLLFKEWNKNLNKLIGEWELEKINLFRGKVLNDFRERLKLLTELKELFNDMSGELGYLWDLSKSELINTDINLLKQWVEFINSRQEITELCNLLGRMRQYFQSAELEKVMISETLQSYIPDINSKEEIVGVKLGKDLEHLLPQETALLSDDELSILFDLKFIEGKLMCFDFQGNSKTEEQIEKESFGETKEEKGPIIICVDTSGSMNGTPENIAKAITLILSSQAVSQDRDCLLINFSTSIEVMELGGKLNVKGIFNFLKKSFHGGTNVAPAINHAVEMTEKEKFENADILIISDFIMQNLPKSILDKIKEIKLRNNKLFSLCIGDEFLDNKLKNVFDAEWVYNSTKTSIEVIKQLNDSFER